MTLRWFLTRVAMIAYPIIEILLIFWVGNTIGWGWTALLLVLGVVVGFVVMRAAGRDAFSAIATPMQRHQPYVEIDEQTGVAQTVHPNSQPSAEEIEQASGELRQSGVLFLSGVLFAIPGFLTDVVAALLLLPPVRRFAAGRMPQGSAAPTVVVQGETVHRSDDTAATPYDSQEPGGPVVIRGEILPPERPIE